MNPIREIHEIEVTSRCNLACVYCPHPTMERPKVDTLWSVFERALDHARYYVRAGTQTELSLTGIGEPTLHPQFPEMLAAAREVLGWDRLLCFSTNGIDFALDMGLALRVAPAKPRVYVSLHRPEMAGPAIQNLRAAGLEVHVNKAFVDSSIDWAGQVEWSCTGPRHVCTYLKAGWAVVRSGGEVTTCCMDAHGLQYIGHVDDELGTLMTRAGKVCKTCHLIVPEEMRKEAA